MQTRFRLASVWLALSTLTSACLAPEFRIALDGTGGTNGSGASPSVGGSSGGGLGAGGSSSGGVGAGAAPGVGGTSSGGSGAGGASTGGSSSGGGSSTGGGPGTGGSGSGPAVLTGLEEVGATCPLPFLKNYAELDPYEKLPSPFVMADGGPVLNKRDWECHHREIVAMLEGYELGDKPSKPTSVTGSVTGSQFTVSLQHGSETGSFSTLIEYPTNGATGPYPAMIVLGGSLLADELRGLGVATITLDVEGEIRPLDDRMTGTFTTFTGQPSPGALLAWSWGASRVLDALEVTPEADVDAEHVGVTGCPFGTAALVAGALDARLALTVVQDTAAGGVAPWRVAAADDANSFDDVVYEHLWFGEAIEMFSGAVERMPYDRHLLVGLVAPRGLLMLANDNVSYLPNATAQGMHYGRDVFTALGATSNVGFVIGTHSPCDPAAGSTEFQALGAFVQQFLQGESAETNYWVDGTLPEDPDWRSWYGQAELPD